MWQPLPGDGSLFNSRAVETIHLWGMKRLSRRMTYKAVFRMISTPSHEERDMYGQADLLLFVSPPKKNESSAIMWRGGVSMLNWLRLPSYKANNARRCLFQI